MVLYLSIENGFRDSNQFVFKFDKKKITENRLRSRRKSTFWKKNHPKICSELVILPFKKQFIEDWHETDFFLSLPSIIAVVAATIFIRIYIWTFFECG